MAAEKVREELPTLHRKPSRGDRAVKQEVPR